MTASGAPESPKSRTNSANGAMPSSGPPTPSASVFMSPAVTSSTTQTSPGLGPSDSPEPAKLRWVLTPRRGHAALNAGIRSLGDREVTLVASPGDMFDPQGDPLRMSDLSQPLRKELEAGLAALRRSGSAANQADKLRGIQCRPVWLEDDLACNFYEGYCKGYLWPIFHYFVRRCCCGWR